MNVLILGSGGREHAFAWKISQSPLLDQLYVAPGNSGTAEIAKNIAISVNDFEAIGAFVRSNNISMVVVGPEDPLVNGIVDFFDSRDDLAEIKVIGPSAEAAQLEGSKDYAKSFMKRHKIPTADYQTFTAETIQEGKAFLETLQPPYVLKADGLAAGKGVLILDDIEQARAELEAMLLHSKFGKASASVVIEEFLSGIELSCFVLTDGKSYKTLPNAKDYKRIGENDTGLNTGGMGAVSPVPFADEVFLQKVDDQIIKPTIQGIASDRLNYKGFIFIGLINVNGQPKVIEYNVRMGDPETEVVLPRIENDLLEMLDATAENRLEDVDIKVDSRACTTVMLVSGGYPEAYEKGKAIRGIDKVDNAIVFHAGAQQDAEKIVTSGGRVLAITAYGDDFRSALDTSYKNITRIAFDGMYYRKDIGFDL